MIQVRTVNEGRTSLEMKLLAREGCDLENFYTNVHVTFICVRCMTYSENADC